MGIENILFEPGYMTLVKNSGAPTRYAIADVLRALDIPAGLTHTQVKPITALANMIADLTKKLISAGILDAEFTGEDGYNLEAIVQAIESMGGDYGEPDLSVT